MWKLGISFLIYAILTSSENVQNHFHRLLLHLRSQTKITEFSLMYGIIILSHNYWFSLPLDMLIILISHTHTNACTHLDAAEGKILIWHLPYFLEYTEQLFLKKKVIRNCNMHLIHDKAGNSYLFKDYKHIQFIHDEPDNSAWTILHETPPYSFQVLS